MRFALLGCLLLLFSAIAAAQQLQLRSVSIDKLDGGSVSMSIGTTTVNSGSSLRRTWYTINDSTCPLQIVGGKLRIQPSPWATYFTYQPHVSVLVTDRPVSALELRYVLLDIFGKHIATIGEFHVRDVPQTDNFPLPPSPFDALAAPRPKKGKPPAVEDRPPGILEAPLPEVQRLHSAVILVARVRLPDGTVWNHDAKSLSEEIGKSLGTEFPLEVLQTTRERK